MEIILNLLLIYFNQGSKECDRISYLLWRLIFHELGRAYRYSQRSLDQATGVGRIFNCDAGKLSDYLSWNAGDGIRLKHNKILSKLHFITVLLNTQQCNTLCETNRPGPLCVDSQVFVIIHYNRIWGPTTCLDLNYQKCTSQSRIQHAFRIKPFSVRSSFQFQHLAGPHCHHASKHNTS